MIWAGGRFSSRFQEDCWGVYREGDVFRYWSEQINEDGSRTSREADLSREQVSARLSGNYSFSMIKAGVRFEELVIDGRNYSIDINHFSMGETAREISDMKELSKLEFFPGLTSADFANSNLNGEGLWCACECPGLTDLNLEATRITDADLPALFQCPGLKVLRLNNNTQLSDNATEHLALLPSLEDLRIERTSITGAGIKNLAFMPSLRQIFLRLENGAFTRAGLATLSTQLPACKILVQGAGQFARGEFAGEWPD